MYPITLAVVGDDAEEVKLLGKLHNLDPSKIIVVGGGERPLHYHRPFESSPFCTDLVDSMYPHPEQPLIYPKKEVLAVSEKVLALLKRAA
jgi:hypothetical protein